jgi:transposase
VIGLGRRQRVYAYGAAVDLRKGFDGLLAIVEQELGRDALVGDLYLFVSRNRLRAKVLLWDGTGLCVYAKRLERGRFACLWREEAGTSVELTASELALFLEGSQLVGKVALSPPDFSFERACKPASPMRESARAVDRAGAGHRGVAPGDAAARS